MSAAPQRDPLMSVREAAALLGYASEWPVRRLVNTGQLRAHRIRGRIKISQDAIDELLAATEIPRDPERAQAAPARSDRTGRPRARDTAGSSSAPWERRRARGAR